MAALAFLVIAAGSPAFTPWELVDIDDPAPDTGDTSGATTRPSPTDPSPYTQPAPDVERLEGTYRGLEHYALGTGRCRFLDHELDSTFALTNGTTWQHHADYCGTLDGNLWTGAGTFVFTAPDGSTLIGEFTSSARLPTTGEPYELTITDGTQRFEGKSGSCALDNYVTVLEFGVQEQAGTFVCDIAGPSTPAPASEAVVTVQVPPSCPTQSPTTPPPGDVAVTVGQIAIEYFQQYANWDPAASEIRAVYKVGETAEKSDFAEVFARNVPKYCGPEVADGSYAIELYNPPFDFPGHREIGAVVVAHFSTGWRVWGVFHGPVGQVSG